MSAPASPRTEVPERFDPDAVVSFHVDAPDVTWSAHEVEVRFPYRLCGDGSSAVVACEERFIFPLPSTPIDAVRTAAFERLLPHLGLVAGISYYKLAAPGRVVVESGSWTAAQIDAHRTILTRGLGEYCFVNSLPAELWPTYEYRSVASPGEPVALLPASAGPLVPVGGGKDSCVTVEALRRAGLAATLVTVNRYPVIQEVIDDAGLPDVAVRRILDPQLRDLNARGARNGHVPATAIVSLAVMAAGALLGHDAVVMSNERSASEGNVTYRGVEINHQWSKSEEAEEILRTLLNSEIVGLDYFSLLRPLSELSIARAFAASSARYFDSFSSCNAAFRLDPARRVSRWCGQCPKCQFVYLALATALDRSTLLRIWGSDVFASSPIEGFRSLLGLSEWKPFECVGESGECRVALSLVAARAEWHDHATLRTLVADVRAAGRWPSADEAAAVFVAAPAASLPHRFAAIASSIGGSGGER